MGPEQLAYLISAAVTWIWAISQLRIAMWELWHWPPQWRWRATAAQWMLAKAVFISYVGVATWGVIPEHAPIVYLFAGSHVVAFVHWLRLPSPAKTDPVYLPEGGE